MDIYYEKNVVNEKMHQNEVRTKFLRVLWWILLAVMMIGIIILTSAPFTNDLPHIIGRVLSYVFLLGTTIGGILFINHYFKKNNSEYDYIVSGSTFKIVRILNVFDIKRKLIFETETLSLVSVGLTSSDEYARIKESSGAKIINAYCADSEDYLYFYCTVKSEKTLVICEYDEEFVQAIKKSGITYGVLGEELRAI